MTRIRVVRKGTRSWKKREVGKFEVGKFRCIWKVVTEVGKGAIGDLRLVTILGCC